MLICKEKFQNNLKTEDLFMKKETIMLNGIKYERCVKGLALRPVGTDIKSKAYMHWQGMILRTLDENAKGNIAKWYKETVICDEWIWFDNFERWFNDNYIDAEGLRYELDKDLICDRLGLDVKIYSPTTCCLLPKDINNLLTYRQNNRAKSYDGTALPCNIHERHTKKGYVYNAQVRLGRNSDGQEIRKSTPPRNTIQEAWEDAYILKREAIFERAEKYKEYITKGTYLALLQYEPKKY